MIVGQDKSRSRLERMQTRKILQAVCFVMMIWKDCWRAVSRISVVVVGEEGAEDEEEEDVEDEAEAAVVGVVEEMNMTDLQLVHRPVSASLTIFNVYFCAIGIECIK